MLNFLKDSCW